MSDRRLTPDSGRRALGALRGLVARDFTDGDPARVTAPLADLCARAGGPRDRQLLHGASVLVIDQQDDWSFVQADLDLYCGWLPSAALGQATQPTHRVSALSTHLYTQPDLKSPEAMALPMNARLTLGAEHNGFLQTDTGLWVPLPHVSQLSAPAADPVTIARQFVGVPYLWGGNSCWGIDCSGLVQVALTACARPCPADSDLQRQALGPSLPDSAEFQRGDLLFWKGHVAFVSAPDLLLHATAYGMAVIEEPLHPALARIEGQSPRLAHIRPSG